jgi:hypothetical protein
MHHSPFVTPDLVIKARAIRGVAGFVSRVHLL